MDQLHVMSMTPSSVAFQWLTHFYFHFFLFCFLGVKEGGEGGSWSDEVLVLKNDVSLFACLLCVYTVLSNSINTPNSPL